METPLYNFNADDVGQFPAARLTPFHDVLYGTTVGGTRASATLFSYDRLTGLAARLYKFSYAAGSISSRTVYQGKLFGSIFPAGSGNGYIFSFDPSTKIMSDVYTFAGGSDGRLPKGKLTFYKGLPYGVTYDGGASGDGTVFSLDPVTWIKTRVHDFTGSDGKQPLAGLAEARGILDGTTSGGGTQESGVIFQLTP